MTNVKTKQTVVPKKRRRSSLQPNRADLSSWSNSDRAELDCPDYYGFNVDATSTLTGFEDSDLAILPVFKGENVTYTVNAAQNRINFTGVGVVTGFTWNGKTFSCANGVCALSTDNLKFYFENAVFGGFFVSDFKPLDQLGGVKIGDIYVVNNASGEAQVGV